MTEENKQRGDKAMVKVTWDHIHLRTTNPEGMAQWFEKNLGAYASSARLRACPSNCSTATPSTKRPESSARRYHDI
jgi:hypothetical protein